MSSSAGIGISWLYEVSIIGVPQKNGCFITENPIKIDDLGVISCLFQLFFLQVFGVYLGMRQNYDHSIAHFNIAPYFYQMFGPNSEPRRWSRRDSGADGRLSSWIPWSLGEALGCTSRCQSSQRYTMQPGKFRRLFPAWNGSIIPELPMNQLFQWDISHF